MKAIDLFAGAGGFSTGAIMAGCNVVWAGNHWQSAVDIHRANHPGTVHVCQDLHQANWAEVPAHDLMLASPSCVGHARARGRESLHHDAARATAWAPVSSAEVHRPKAGIIENVPEFLRWQLFPAWSDAMRALGYSLSINIVDVADLGVPQHRVRVFIVLTRSKNPIKLNLPKRPHVAAAKIIDFDAGRWSKIEKPGRSMNTLRRIENGRRAFGDRFVAPYYGSGSGETGRSLKRPLGTITTRDRWAVIDGDRMRMLSVDENRAAMGFPATYRLPTSHKLAVHMLGNAVPPIAARDVIQALRKAA